MAKGKLQGRRLADGSSIADVRNPGDYLRVGTDIMWGIDPSGATIRLDSRWKIKENNDGSISVTDSIWTNKPHGWHGYLTNGIWEDV